MATWRPPTFTAYNASLISRDEMAEEISRRFGVQVTMAMVRNAYRRFGIRGRDTRIQPGNIPPNKGKKGYSLPGSERTQFKVGHRPKNWLPIGSERTNSDGFLQVKLTDTGYPPRDWVMKSTIEWEKVNGQIPEGHLLRFIDGNRANCNPENLLLVSRQENAVMNRWLRLNDLPEGGLIAVHLMAKIKIAARLRSAESGGRKV